MPNQILRSNCRRCSRQTRQEVLYAIENKADEPYYNELHTWQVLRCMGCESIGFRYRYDDFDDVSELPSGRTQHATKYYRYPNAIPGHRPLEYLHAVPAVIRQVYNQTISAYAGDASILAGMGLRATIEAVCNHLAISGSSLEKRIDQLYKTGFISSNDKRRLHAIRFLGNDAAHEIRQPKAPELRVALEIVEHLINSVFILELRAKNLDVQVETFDQFKELVQHCVMKVHGEQALSLTAILGRNKRRVSGDIAPLEDQLIAIIQSGSFEFLKLDSVQQVEGKDVQLYTVDKAAFDDDIPF
jgi:hypothetical protein